MKYLKNERYASDLRQNTPLKMMSYAVCSVVTCFRFALTCRTYRKLQQDTKLHISRMFLYICILLYLQLSSVTSVSSVTQIFEVTKLRPTYRHLHLTYKKLHNHFKFVSSVTQRGPPSTGEFMYYAWDIAISVQTPCLLCSFG